MAGIKEYSTTAANNTAINSISIAEGCAPSGINDAIRQGMADTRSFYESGGWIDLGYTHNYASSTSVTVSSQDVTTKYPAGRRIRAVGSSTGTIYGKVASSSFSTNTTINFTWDSGSLSNETLTISVGFLNVTGKPIDSSAIGGSLGTVTQIIASTGLTGGTITGSGTIAVDVGLSSSKIVQLDATGLPALNASQLTALNASNLASGTVGTARLGSGTANSSSYLRGDQTWAAISGGGYVYVNSAAPSGTAVTFTGLQSGYDYILTLDDVSSTGTGGAANILVQVGVGGTYRTSGYVTDNLMSTSYSSPTGGLLTADGRGAAEGVVEILNPAAAGTKTKLHGFGSASGYNIFVTGGRYDTAEANDCIRVVGQGGNSLSGTMIMLFSRKRS